MIPDFRKMLTQREYDFLRENEHLGKRIMLLGLSGSYGYGTNREGSDVDFRGVALQRPSDLLGLTEFEQYVDSGTDTVVYGFNKLVRLLMECNPNCCEILGLTRDKYLILSSLGKELINQQGLFLSKSAIKSFGGYASAQLRRLQNAIARDALSQPEREKHILNSVKNALEDFNRKSSWGDLGGIRLYIDQAVTPQMETEIFVDANYQHLPLREYNSMMDTMQCVVREYDRVGHRNHKKDANHLNKHAMHLVRLLMTGADILNKHRIITCRVEELPLLMNIRNGMYMREDGTMSPEFFEILDMYERKFDEAAAQTTLPERPDMEKIGAFVEHINRCAIMEE
ncbi:MAG: nucleotidyltransferase domain-containing protein [Clostridia bacterium]|nr:nucleotidyltransferase domain-containing protein [Clostridia bacterium]